MSVPGTWLRMTLDSLGTWGSGGTPSRTNPAYFEGGSIPWLVIGDLTDSLVTKSAEQITESGLANSSAKLIPPGTLLVGMYGSIGKLGIAGIPCATNQAIAFCKPAEDLVNGKYLFYALMHAKPQLNARGQGGTQRNISQGILRSFEVPVAPLSEQRRIADKLDVLLTRVDGCRDRLERVAAILQRFRRAVLNAATTGELTADWRLLNPLPTGTAETEVGARIAARRARARGKKAFKEPAPPDLSHWNVRQPPSWTLSSVSAFADCLDHLRIPVTKAHRNRSRGLYPYYGANGQVDLVDEYIFDGELVLVTEDETFFGREKPIAYRTSGRCWVNNHAHVLLAGEKSRADYLCFALMYYDVLPWLTGTTGRAKLTQGVLNSLPIAVPPQSELLEIVRRVQSLLALADSVEARVIEARSRVDRAVPALLEKAFRGELVPHEPNDEPASDLIARVRAEREATAPESASRPPRTIPHCRTAPGFTSPDR